MKHTGAPLFFVLSLCPCAFAQSITGTVATAGILQATYGAQVQTVTLPAGPMAAQGGQFAVAGQTGNNAWVSMSWSSGASASFATFSLNQNAFIEGAGPAASSFGPGDFLLSLQAPTAMPARLVLHQDLVVFGGVTTPTLTVDVNDDGSIEFMTSPFATATLPITLVPAGVPVRVRTQIALGTAGSVGHNLRLTLLPADTLVQRVGLGCHGADMMSVEPTFAGDVYLIKQGCTNCYTWIPVVGFSIQPVALPALSPLCVLLPAPDVVLFASLSHSMYGFPVPAAVRPITFWAQAVELSPFGFRTGSTFEIDAF